VLGRGSPAARTGISYDEAMAQTYSFDVTSNIEMPEVDNAVNQARKEIGQRFDFKGSLAAIDLDQKANTLTLTAEDNFKLESVWDVLQTRLIKRNVPVKNLTRGDITPAAGSTVKQVITLQQGIPTEAAKEIVKHLKDLKKKVQAAIQADQVRVSSASKDELQGAMQALRAKDFGVALQFGNYR
jgi:cyclic-di-GMP-binding protein